MYQNEHTKVNEYLGKQESLEKRLSQLQSENVLLRQQLDDAQSRADSRENSHERPRPAAADRERPAGRT